MKMEHQEFIEIRNQMQDHFDGRYVKIEDCESTVEKEEQNQQSYPGAFPWGRP